MLDNLIVLPMILACFAVFVVLYQFHIHADPDIGSYRVVFRQKANEYRVENMYLYVVDLILINVNGGILGHLKLSLELNNI